MTPDNVAQESRETPPAEPVVVAVIGSVFPIPPEAGTPRPFQLLSRIARRTEVHCLGVVSQSPEEWERFREHPSLRDVFTSTSAFYRRQETPWLAQLASFASARPTFDLRFRDPAVLRAAQARARALVRAHGRVVFYCWERDTLQYVPRDLWRSTTWDLVDDPVLEIERRLAVDETLGLWERAKLRAALLPLRRFERRALRRVGRPVLSSSADIAALRERAPDAAIANVVDGADTEYFSPARVTDASEAAADLLFFGNLAVPQNGDAALHLVRDVMPLVWRARPDARAIVVGPEPPEALRVLQDGRRVLVTGFVPDLRPHLARATVIVSPLRFGAGMKHKLQAALAMGKATIASRVTCEGFDRLESGVHALVADGAAEIARAALALLDDPARRRALGAAGCELIRSHYGWDAAAEVLWENLRHLPAATGAAAGASSTDKRSTYARADSA
jgi:glycosyltransferase involved in cell wall biosynthesis